MLQTIKFFIVKASPLPTLDLLDSNIRLRIPFSHTCQLMYLGRGRCSREESVRLDLKEIGVDARNFIDSAAHGLFESPCECGIEPSDSLSHGVS
jgi:hypothetical protein